MPDSECDCVVRYYPLRTKPLETIEEYFRQFLPFLATKITTEGLSRSRWELGFGIIRSVLRGVQAVIVHI
jgi:hypothetical protein